MTMAPDILIQEVAPRDGLQIESRWVETGDKIRLIDSLSAIGFTRIEVSSFVSPKAVPALRDAEEVFAGIARSPGTVYTALVPNRKGAELALAARADELRLKNTATGADARIVTAGAATGLVTAAREPDEVARRSGIEP